MGLGVAVGVAVGVALGDVHRLPSSVLFLPPQMKKQIFEEMTGWKYRFYSLCKTERERDEETLRFAQNQLLGRKQWISQ